MNGQELIASIVTDAERIEREKNGQALTKDEADKIRAAAFLRKIAPYAFEK